MVSTPESREALLRSLIEIPSVTGSAREDEAARFVRDKLAELAYFKENPAHLQMFPTPLEGDRERPLHTVCARMMAPVPTQRTVVFIAHYDVVDVACYGDLAPWAFDPDELAARLEEEDLPERVLEDLRSGGYLFGRGSMDMKCGLALEMELLRDFDDDRNLFDVNIVVLAVPDEENTACGMRKAARHLAELKAELGLHYMAGIDLEPTEPGLQDAKEQVIFLGTLGKLLPTFYCRGIEAHVGNYYRGISAALLSSHIVCIAEGDPDLADPERGMCQPSWICLNQRVLAEGYSVTVPNRAVAYFNCFAMTKTPADVLRQMRAIAKRAAERTLSQLKKSYQALAAMGYAAKSAERQEIRVMTFEDIFELASVIYDGGAEALEAHMASFLDSLPPADLRDCGLAALEELIRISAIEPPFVAVGFLPPYNPQKTSLDDSYRSNVLVRAVDRVIEEAWSKYGVRIETAEFFAGLSDMSFLGLGGKPADIKPFQKNCPGGERLFDLPVDALREIDMPVMNMGVCGFDAHRRTERLEKRYSLEILPELILSAVRALSAECDAEDPTAP